MSRLAVVRASAVSWWMRRLRVRFLILLGLIELFCALILLGEFAMAQDQDDTPVAPELKGRGGITDWLMPEKIKELLTHVTIDADTGRRTVSLPSFTITFDKPSE